MNTCLVPFTSLPTLLGRRIVLRLLLRPSLGSPRIHTALRAPAVQHLHLAIDIHHDFGGVPVLPVLTLPFAGLQTTFNINLGTLFKIIANYFSKPTKSGNINPLSFFYYLSGLLIFVVITASYRK